MSLDAVVEYLEQRFANQIASHNVIDATEGEFDVFPDSLAPQLQTALQAGGMTSLYSHQSEAYESIRQGQDTVLVSRTASGKTLSFLLPILQT